MKSISWIWRHKKFALSPIRRDARFPGFEKRRNELHRLNKKWLTCSSVPFPILASSKTDAKATKGSLSVTRCGNFFPRERNRADQKLQMEWLSGKWYKAGSVNAIRLLFKNIWESSSSFQMHFDGCHFKISFHFVPLLFLDKAKCELSWQATKWFQCLNI